MIDVKGRRCEVVHCTKIAGYGVQGRQPSACLLHRESGMVDMKQHRPRLGSGKPGSINVNLGSGGAAAAAAESSASSFAKWGRRSRKNLYGVPGGGSNGVLIAPSSQSAVATAGGIDSASSLDLMRFTRHANNPSGSQQWYSDAGYSSGVSSQSGGQALRSWVMGGTPQPLGGGGSSGPGVPTVGMWAFNQPSPGTASSSRGAQTSAGEGGGGGMQHPSSHWTPSQETGGSQSNDGSHYPSPHESGTSNGMVGRASSSLGSAEAGGGRFSGGGSSYGNDGGGGGSERDGGGAWRSGAPGASGFNEGFHQQFSGSGQGVDQNGYAIVPSLSGGRGGSGGGGGGGADAINGGPSSAKADHGPNSEVGIVDVETEDIWLRDLMQGTMTRDSQQNGGGGAADMPHSSSAATAGFQRSTASHTASGSQHYPRHLGPASSAGTGDHAPSSRSGTPSSSSTSAAAALAEDRRFYQVQQHRQQQHSQQRQQSSHSGSGGGGGSGSGDQASRPAQHYDPVRDPVLAVPSGGRFKEAMNANARAKGMPVHMTMGRSPSTASNGASPPHDSGSPTDAMPPRHVGGSKHDGVGGGASVAAGGGGGNPGMGSNGFMSRSSARGAGPPNHLFTSLSAMAGHDGGGYGMGLNSDMQLMSASRVNSPSWGGV